ncbi:MAG: ROK family protein [Pseudomonadota bacterium]|nr:ROK family protein [Pseudomonadota bacterium]
MTVKPLFGGVELGGTKCICLIASAPDDIRAQLAIPTGSDPKATLERLIEQLQAWRAVHGPIETLGVGSFGPIDRSAQSPTYGHITSTPKPGWRFVDVAGTLSRAMHVPVRFDTDVNGAALAEGRWGAARDLEDFAYVTVGTGVGVGLVVNGALAHGFAHPELGHMRIARQPGDHANGACALHADCVEGFASGTAIAARTGTPAPQVAADDPVWQGVAHALGQLLHTIVLATAPRRIILSGGVAQARPELLPEVRRLLLHSLNGYVALETLAGPIDEYVVAAGLGAQAGPLGALALAVEAYRTGQTS